jgi:murein DD-endopeptidase MepM/ murein hydrolase activator NlpD
MRLASAYRTARRRRSGISAERHAGIIWPRRRTALFWKVFAARSALLNSAARKASTRTSTAKWLAAFAAGACGRKWPFSAAPVVRLRGRYRRSRCHTGLDLRRLRNGKAPTFLVVSVTYFLDRWDQLTFDPANGLGRWRDLRG